LLTLVAVAIVLVGAFFIHKEMNTVNTTVTTVRQQHDNPTGKTISPTATAILFHAQTASAIDNTLTPTQLTSTFETNQHVYVTFQIDSKGLDGTIQARWYANGQQVSISMFHHTHGNMKGLVSYMYTVPANAGVVALFWCIQKDCSDAQLATVLHFTVLIGTGPIISIELHAMAISNKRLSDMAI